MSTSNARISGSAIAFIDRQVADYQSLIAGVTPGTEVVILDENRDAIEQITQILALRSNIDSIHIVSHGAPGNLQLGKTSFSQDNLETYSEKLQQWRSALNLGADILIYGCNVASGPRACPTIRRGINSPSHSASRFQPTENYSLAPRDCPKVRQGINSLSHSESRLKPTENYSLAPRDCPKVRQGINSLSHSESRLKPTENKADIQSSSEDFRYETGVSTPGGSEEYAINDERAIDPKYAINDKRAIAPKYAIDRKQKIDGFTFIQRIAQLTNTNVAASKNLTGSAAKGGDWELEVTTGKIAASLAFRPEVIAAYSHVLSTFSEARNYGVTHARDMDTGDLNGDGFLDLVVVGNTTYDFKKDISILLGTGTTGSFGTAISLFPQDKENPTGVVVRDFNGDGKLDLATANFGFSNNGYFVSIRLGTGTGSFGNPTNFGQKDRDGQNINHSSIAAGDFNGDGKLDLATVPLAGNNISTISLLFGDGTGSFGNPVPINTNKPKSTVATADFNGDGKLDLVTSNIRSNAQVTDNISVFLGDGNGNFNSPVNLTAPTAGAGRAVSFSGTIGKSKSDRAI